MKLNSDGSSLIYPGTIGGGGYDKDSKGEMLFAFSTPVGDGTNNQAKIGAALFGLDWCIQ